MNSTNPSKPTPPYKDPPHELLFTAPHVTLAQT
nr:MAG TPA: hypothetical protein [Caudoviricetes sp.]